MSTWSVNKKLVIKEIYDLSDVETALVELGTIDSDFCGSNGDDFLWEEAKDKGFETNAEFLANYVTSYSERLPNKSVVDYCNRFTEEWMKRDSYYSYIVIDVVKLNGSANDPVGFGIYAFNITAIDYN